MKTRIKVLVEVEEYTEGATFGPGFYAIPMLLDAEGLAAAVEAVKAVDMKTGKTIIEYEILPQIRDSLKCKMAVK